LSLPQLVLDAVTDMYVHHVNGLTTEGENLDEIVLAFNADEREDVLRRVGLARHFAINLLSHLWAKRELVGALINKDYALVTKNTKVYLRDVMDHTLRMEEKLRVTQEILNYTSATYLARVSIEAAESANQMNAIMKRFG
jgi:magnesium transporter